MWIESHAHFDKVGGARAILLTERDITHGGEWGMAWWGTLFTPILVANYQLMRVIIKFVA